MKFANKCLATSLVCVMLTFSVACNSATALADVEKFEPVVLNALTLACTISSSLPICGVMEATIQNDYNLVIKLWGDWNTAVANGTSSSALWNDLNAAFQTFEQDSAAIFSAGLGLNTPELTAIIASAQVLLAAIEAVFPAAPAGTVVANAVRSRRFTQYRDPNFTLKSWRKDYNQRLSIAQRVYPAARLRKV